MVTVWVGCVLGAGSGRPGCETLRPGFPDPGALSDDDTYDWHKVRSSSSMLAPVCARGTTMASTAADATVAGSCANG